MCFVIGNLVVMTKEFEGVAMSQVSRKMTVAEN